MLDINPLSCKFLSHSVGCLFFLLMVSSAVSHLFIFAFISFALGDRSKTLLLRFMSKNVLPMFFSRCLWFPVLHLGL